jgi:hypothetical protein
MIWIVKSRNPRGSVNRIHCETPRGVIEIVADQRNRGLHEVWIEDDTGEKINEADFKR